MADNKRLSVPLTFVKHVPTAGNMINMKEVEQMAASIRPAVNVTLPTQSQTESVTTGISSAEKRINRPREMSEGKPTKEVNQTIETHRHDKTQKPGIKFMTMALMRIISRKMYSHFHQIKDNKRKAMLRRTFLKTLAALEHSKMNQFKSMAWFQLQRNCYHIDKTILDKSQKGIIKAKESNTKKCILILRRRYHNLLKNGIDKIRKNSKKITLMGQPTNALSSIFIRKIQAAQLRALFRIKRYSKRKDLFKIGSNVIKNLFKTKLAQHLAFLRCLPSTKPTIGSAPVSVTKVGAGTPNRGSRSGSLSNVQPATQSTPRKVIGSSRQPIEEDKLNIQLQELTRQKETISSEARANLSSLDENIQSLEKRIEQETKRQKEIAVKSQQTISPTKSQKSATKVTGQEDNKDPYFEILRTIYENVSNGPDSLRKRDVISKFQLDLDQLEDTVEHQLDRNQQLKDTINHIEDFLCPDQAIERPEIQIDEANRLMQHENSQLKKVLQRYLVESYGRNLIEEAKKCYALLSDKISQQQRSSPTRN